MSKLWLVGLVALAVLFVGAMVLEAQDNTPAPGGNGGKGKGGMRGQGGAGGGPGGGMRGPPVELTPAQQTALEKPQADIKVAIEAFQKAVAAQLTDPAQAQQFVRQFVMQQVMPAGARGGKAAAPKAPDASAPPPPPPPAN